MILVTVCNDKFMASTDRDPCPFLNTVVRLPQPFVEVKEQTICYEQLKRRLSKSTHKICLPTWDNICQHIPEVTKWVVEI